MTWTQDTPRGLRMRYGLATGLRCVAGMAALLWCMGLLPGVPREWPMAVAQAVEPAEPALVGPGARRELHVVSDDNFPPFLFRGPDGQPQGYVVDLWRLWEERTGVRVRLTATQWDEAQRLIRSGRADVIDMIYRTPARESSYDFSPPYADQPVAIFRHASVQGVRDVSGLQGFLVGVQAGDACIDRLAAAGITQVRTYPNYAALLDGAVADQVRLFCLDEYPANYYLTQRGLQQTYVKAFELYRGQLHRAVRKGDAATLALVEQGMARLTPQELQALQARWLTPRPPRTLPTEWAWAAAALLALALLLAAAVLTLRRQVRRRTAELERERHLLAAIVDAIPDLVWLKDPNGRFLACNRRFESLYGVPQKALLGRTDYDFVDPETADRFRAHDRRAAEAGQPMRNEEVLTFASDGHSERVQTIKTPIHDRDGRLIGVLGIARDLTELLAARDRLAHARERLQRIFAATDSADWTVDLATQQWYWDAAMDRLLGRGADAPPPGPEALLQALDPGEHEAVRAALARAQAGETVAPLRVALTPPHQAPQPARLMLLLEYDAHQRPVRLHGVLWRLPAAVPASAAPTSP